MRARTLAVSLLAAVLVATPATTALAHQSSAGKAATKSAEAAKAKAKAKAHGTSAYARAAKAAAKAAKAEAKAARAKKHGSVVLGGTVVSVTAAVPATAATAATDNTDTTAATATVTFVVHGGRFKDLRGQTVTASVADTAKVTRGGEAVLTDLVAGDHVNVKWKRVDFSYTAPAAGVVTSTTPTVLTGEATRVAASPAETDAEVPAS